MIFTVKVFKTTSALTATIIITLKNFHSIVHGHIQTHYTTMSIKETTCIDWHKAASWLIPKYDFFNINILGPLKMKEKGKELYLSV